MSGYIFVTNLRGDGPQIEDGETPIRIDRANPLFGNPFHMTAKTMSERKRVIDLNNTRIDEDIASGGPMSTEIRALAKRVAAGECIALQCWCAPLPCHGDRIALEINKCVQAMRLITRDAPS